MSVRPRVWCGQRTHNSGTRVPVAIMNQSCDPVTLPTGRHYGTQTHTRTVGRFTLTRTRYAPGFATPWHAHEAAAFCLVIRGDYVERFRRQDVEGRAATVVFRPPRLEHVDVIGRMGASCFIVEPSLDWYAATDVSRVVSLSRAHANRGTAEWYMRRAMSECDSNDPLSPIALEGLILCVMATLTRATLPSTPPRQWLRSVRDRLDAGFAERTTLAELASSVGVHPVHLAATFRRTFGVTVGEYVRQRRVESARRLLTEGTQRITEIALHLGFANPSHFSRVFSKQTGATPLEYRKLHARG